MTRTAIIGGGAAGLVAAIAAAENGESVLVLERNPRPLKKLGVTGNGRCNLLNSGPPVYFGDTAFALNVLERVPYPRLRAFFEGLGVPLREETEGRVYPAALQASVVADALLLRARQLGVELRAGQLVTELDKAKDGFWIVSRETADTPTRSGRAGAKGGEGRADGRGSATGREAAPLGAEARIHADRVIVAAGGAAAPAHGTDGSAYALMTALGHRLIDPRPALCALVTDPAPIAGLSGARLKATLTLVGPDDGKPRRVSGETNAAADPLASPRDIVLRRASGEADASPEPLASPRDIVLRRASGEALFAVDGVSGIAAMQLARFFVPGARLVLDLRPALCFDALSIDELTDRLSALHASRVDCLTGEWLSGLLPARVAAAVLRYAALRDLKRPLATLPPSAPRALARALAAFTLPVRSIRGFEHAQVTAGGLDCADFDPATLQSRLVPDLYAAGELLNVDGDCGGFNLMFAFASGLVAGGGKDEDAGLRPDPVRG